MTTNIPSSTVASLGTNPSLDVAINAACHRIAPLWPLSRFVAVNPFVGLSDHPFIEGNSLLGRVAGMTLAMPSSYYRRLWQDREIEPKDLESAIHELNQNASGISLPSEESLLASVETGQGWNPVRQPVLTFAEAVDSVQGTRWSEFVTEEISKWCSGYFDEGQSLWRMPWRHLPLYAAWREAAARDYNPVAAGLHGWRNSIANLEENPRAEISRAASLLGFDDVSATDLFHRQLLSISGWAGHLQFRAHELRLQGVEDDRLTHLLAIRLAFDAALHAAFSSDPRVQERWTEVLAAVGEPAVLLEYPAAIVWQRAHECAKRRKLFARIRGHVPAQQEIQPTFQALFCIDVRSEIFRRALEAVAPEGQTIGFAGFLGFPIEATATAETHGAPQCPVLLAPAVKVPVKADAAEVGRVRIVKRARESWWSFKSSAVSSFVFVDTAGLGFGAKLARDLTHHSKAQVCSQCDVDVAGIPIATRIKLAAGALRHMGFAEGGLARLVFLCGHGSQTANNPFGSSLDCGACGGHTGEANVKTAVAILNSSEVRKGLSESEGIVIPNDTLFLAGLHNTTTDEVTIFQTAGTIPVTHREEVGKLESALAEATPLAQKERAPRLGLSPKDVRIPHRISVRAHDWAEVRPEWGLAGNYAFLAAPRAWTRGLDLGGRVFLHDYDYARDRGEATLELLLTAPVVVASWINLQYFGSTVDNARMGSGNKVLHNVASALGVFEGNGGDLRSGLPFQSVHDGTNWVHEPVRLNVCVAAPKEAVDRVLDKHPEVSDLVRNEWIHLFVMNGMDSAMEQSDGKGGWR